MDSQPAAADNPSPPREVRYLPTADAYALWAPYYDSDGNFLQALDTLELAALLPAFLHDVQQAKLAALPSHDQTPPPPLPPLNLIDLGCGTGRNTLSLLRHALAYPTAHILALDFSPAMLARAAPRAASLRAALAASNPATPLPAVSAASFDIASPLPLPPSPAQADAAISTLVLEHVALAPFFAACSSLLPAPGARLLLTNMHADMGRLSRAGFVDPVTGAKIRPDRSFAHEVGDVVRVARAHGWVVEGSVRESGVGGEEMVALLGERSRKWFEVGVKTWFGVRFVRV